MKSKKFEVVKQLLCCFEVGPCLSLTDVSVDEDVENDGEKRGEDEETIRY